jgi:hypothetical protein
LPVSDEKKFYKFGTMLTGSPWTALMVSMRAGFSTTGLYLTLMVTSRFRWMAFFSSRTLLEAKHDRLVS